jgi:hypothetical protein
LNEQLALAVYQGLCYPRRVMAGTFRLPGWIGRVALGERPSGFLPLFSGREASVGGGDGGGFRLPPGFGIRSRAAPIYDRSRGRRASGSGLWIELETTPQPFGGRRWWFVCPRTGRRATKLYLPNGAVTFASRQAYQLAYACQREQSHERALRRAFKLRAQLGADGGIGDYIPKPKWMRWPTYERAMTQIERAEEIVDAYTEFLAREVDRRLGKTETPLVKIA